MVVGSADAPLELRTRFVVEGSADAPLELPIREYSR
jgi:hypothetical protein